MKLSNKTADFLIRCLVAQNVVLTRRVELLADELVERLDFPDED